MSPNGRRACRRIVDGVTALTIAGLASLAVLIHLGPAAGIHALAVRGPSMTPALPVGSMIVVNDVEPASIRTGEVVTIRADNGVLITHRVIRTTTASEGTFFETKGDANDTADPVLVPSRNVVGRVTVVVPLVGYLVGMLTTAPGALSVGAFLAVLVLLASLLEDGDRARAPMRGRADARPA